MVMVVLGEREPPPGSQGGRNAPPSAEPDRPCVAVHLPSRTPPTGGVTAKGGGPPIGDDADPRAAQHAGTTAVCGASSPISGAPTR
jgi:hypothetical protein